MGARQQQFVQYCLRLGYGPESSFKDAHSRLYADTDVAFDSLIQRANSSLHALSLVLRSRKDEQSGDTVWAVVNTKADDISKLATPYAHAEMAYMKKIIELIVTSESDEYSITNFDALNVTKALAEKVKLMQKDAQDLLSRFTDDGWLVQYSNGRFALGSRALLELDTYLRNQYPDHIRECHVCHEIVTAHRMELLGQEI
ncbi:hypothetical protein EV182_004209 [Spiromyces aspiralis]|uniref:Uncharacterized protein n=1 Tax=Spiromyces aspiralis TaxID=68401 RepID=A0ACC1HF66_9FUNG|nr:hypothetical protein EV182_004209 [Spiromyces aspiralis]